MEERRFIEATGPRPGPAGEPPAAPAVDPAACYPRWRRRQTLVNARHQLKFTSVLMLQMTTVLVGIAAFGYFESRAAMAVILRHVADAPTSSYELHLNNQSFLAKVTVVIAITAVAQILFGIYASHKLAGPVVKMKQVLEQATRGDYSARIHFRQGDHLEQLATTLNRMLRTLAAEQAAARREAEGIEAEIRRLRGLERTSPEDLRNLDLQLARLAGVEAPEPVTCGEGS
jgi:methyl-accepting chemotaxis protein